MQWMTAEFTIATKDLEDMEAGVGLAAGHVAAIGVQSVTHLMHALMAYSGNYCSSTKWLLRIARMIDTADPELRDALTEGRALAFPPLFTTVEAERRYLQRVLEYCAVVCKILLREEAMADLLASVTHDLDLIA